MNWIYLSPHLDDVAYSCGGLVWSQTSAGDAASIWTVCAGDPPDTDLSPHAATIHARWDLGEDVIAKRRLEDIEACRIMGASQRHFYIPDAIYRAGLRSNSDPGGIEREYYYQERDVLFGPLNPGEKSLVHSFNRVLRKQIERELAG